MIKKNVLRINLFFLFILTSGCIMSIGITSTTTEQLTGKTYRNLLVLARFTDLPFRTLAETTFKDNLMEYAKTNSMISIELFIPVRDYIEQEIKKVLSDKSIDAVILFRLVSSMRDEGVHAKEYKQILDGVNYSEASKVARNPNRRYYEVSLIDAETGKTIWIGKVSISSGQPYRSQYIIDPISQVVIKKLQKLKMLSLDARRSVQEVGRKQTGYLNWEARDY